MSHYFETRRNHRFVIPGGQGKASYLGQDFVERRKQHRFKVKEDAFVKLYTPRFFKLGKPRIIKSATIIDISIGGLAFQYVDCVMLSHDFYELSIFNTTGAIKIDKVPFKAVSDFSISRLSNSKFIRRCGIKFGGLNPAQKSELASLIQNHAIGED